MPPAVAGCHVARFLNRSRTRSSFDYKNSHSIALYPIVKSCHDLYISVRECKIASLTMLVAKSLVQA